MKNALLILFVSVTCINAQTNTSTPVKPALDDCPTWSSKPKNSGKADYFNYLKQTKREKETVNTVAYDTEKAATRTTTARYGQRFVPSKNAEIQITEPEKQIEKIKQPNTVLGEAAKQSEIKPVVEKEKNVALLKTEAPDTTIQNEKSLDGVSTATKSEKNNKNKKDNKLKKKLNRLFSKKSNKVIKPNYKKCTTSF